jgi:hypothetical protein
MYISFYRVFYDVFYLKKRAKNVFLKYKTDVCLKSDTPVQLSARKRNVVYHNFRQPTIFNMPRTLKLCLEL